jgi:hypothetical protein
MARKLFGPGATGDLVGQIQRALQAAGFDPNGIDEVYGNDTVKAVTAFQTANSIEPTGIIDDITWSEVTKTQLPGVNERSLGLTCAFEGHSYTLAKGNFDGAWLTWGIIGFTMKFGMVQAIVLNINAQSPALVTEAFGANAAKLIQMMQTGAAAQEAWANSITVAGGNLAEPWKSAFAAFGKMPEVRSEQRRLAFEKYYKPALQTALNFGLSTELGLALAFDIHVQNGGISAAAAQQIREDAEASHDASEANMREIIADAVADHARAEYQQDVRTRKLTIARGQGTVHGRNYDLSNWGLSDIVASAAAA